MVRIVPSAIGLALAVLQGAQAPLRSPTGFVFDEVYRRHLVGDTGHPERPERLTAVLGGLEKAGLLSTLTRIPARPATDDELAPSGVRLRERRAIACWSMIAPSAT